MLSNRQLADLFIEAYNQDIVTDLADSADCISMCENCRASKACEQLAETEKSFKVFVENYEDQVIPILIERGIINE